MNTRGHWRKVKDEPPPRDGSLILVNEDGRHYAIVFWQPSTSGPVEGVWRLAYSGLTAYITDEKLQGAHWVSLKVSEQTVEVIS